MASITCSLPTNQLNELLYIPLLSVGRYGGYKLEILKQNLSAIEEKFVVCPSCKGIMKNASFSAGKNMCECCCPASEQTVPVESVRETVDKLPCGCPLDSKGCAWTGVIGELETHLCVCEHLMVPCPFVDYGCEVGLVRRLEMQMHLNECITQHIFGMLIKIEGDNRKAFGEIDSLKQENQMLKQELTQLKYDVWKEIMVHKTCLRYSIKGKQLEGFQFMITDVEMHLVYEIHQGPIFYLNRFMIQVEFESNPFFLYIKRIPGPNDNELRNALVGLVCFQFINISDYSILLDINRNIDHPLALNQRSSFICNITGLKKYFVNNHLTVRLFFELKL